MKQFMLEVWGDFACFTRPELKVERFSYPVITPSAARAIFDSIYLRYEPQGRPLFRWEVRRVEVLSPITYIELSRSEVKGKVSVKKVRGCMRSGKPFEPIFANARGPGSENSGRTQRQTIALKNVRYRLHAEAHLYKEDALTRKVIERIFERRAQRGQCVRQPYLGCSEFAAYFQLIDAPLSSPISVSQDLGWMLYDVFDLSQPNSSYAKPSVSLFQARLERGVVEIPAYESDDVKKSERSR